MEERPAHFPSHAPVRRDQGGESLSTRQGRDRQRWCWSPSRERNLPHWRYGGRDRSGAARSEEHTSELQSLMRISYAVFCLKKKNKINHNIHGVIYQKNNM